MWFSVGISELGVVGVFVLVAAILAVLRRPAWRWAMVGSVCLFVATIISPADPISTLLVGAVLFLFFMGGIRFQRRSIAAT